VLALLFLLSLDLAFSQADFYLKSGDRVVFYGDSITNQRLYTTFTETYVVTRFPKREVTFVHSGWGGDRVSGGSGGPIDVRLERDVIAYKPTVMTIMLGMNDGRVRPFDQQLFQTFADGYRHIIAKMRAAVPGIRITAIQPSPYDDVTRAPGFEGGYNAVLVRYGQFVEELAKQEKLAVADLNTPVVAALEKAKAANPELAAKIVPDRVHPGAGGHLLMAEALLKAWNAPPLVAAVEIDAEAKKVTRQENTEVTGLAAGNGLSWTQQDAALPMPYDSKDATLMLAVRSSDFLEALNQEPLKVTGLAAARYSLKIDGEPAGSFTREQLATGINLAELPTPMARQAAEVHRFTLEHNNVHFSRWHTIEVDLEKDSLARKQAAIAALDALDDELVQKQRAAAQPRARRFELTAE
jgi:lysophospholipase L1-like esterase